MAPLRLPFTAELSAASKSLGVPSALSSDANEPPTPPRSPPRIALRFCDCCEESVGCAGGDANGIGESVAAVMTAADEGASRRRRRLYRHALRHWEECRHKRPRRSVCAAGGRIAARSFEEPRGELIRGHH